uniref:Glyceraldehyde 3-phosphate dehydrogenase NAD(P) binding domain-containing protein n=1 Tax=Aegilops tauschii subsp. strangulata TaxID=200361 RepID=A0A453HWJ8_AEGTS
MAYMFKYDSTDGPFKGSIKVVDDSILEINAKKITTTSKSKRKWGVVRRDLATVALGFGFEAPPCMASLPWLHRGSQSAGPRAVCIGQCCGGSNFLMI